MPQEYREKASTYWLISQRVGPTHAREGGNPVVMKTLDSICGLTASVLKSECYKLWVGLTTCDSDPQTARFGEWKKAKSILFIWNLSCEVRIRCPLRKKRTGPCSSHPQQCSCFIVRMNVPLHKTSRVYVVFLVLCLLIFAFKYIIPPYSNK